MLTILIILRLYMYRRRLLTSLPPEHARHYVSLATIVVESAALYSVFAILFLITYAVGHPTNQIFLGRRFIDSGMSYHSSKAIICY